MKNWPTFFRLLAIILTLNASLPAQENQPQAVNENPLPPEVSSQVFFRASVWDASAKGYVKGLKSKDFSITIGGEPREISFFQESDTPATVGILFDVSGSMSGGINSPKEELESGVNGLNTFIQNSNPNNKYFLVAFSLAPSLIQDTTAEREKIETAFITLRTTSPKGNTRIFSSMKYCVEKLIGEPAQKKILLVVSDGIENSSKRRDYLEVRDYVRKDGILVYMINHQRSFDQFVSEVSLAHLFEKIAEESGGRVLYPQNIDELMFSFTMIASESRNQYLIGFMPKSNQKPEWKRMKIKLNGTHGTNKLRINAPDGYFF